MSEQEMASLTGTGYHYYEVMCMGLGIQWFLLSSLAYTFNIKYLSYNQDANEVSPLLQRGEGDLTSPLLVDGRRRDILTAFQRYRNSRLSADFQTEITDRSLAECLDECLRQVSES